jgi:hypothetical protein
LFAIVYLKTGELIFKVLTQGTDKCCEYIYAGALRAALVGALVGIGFFTNASGNVIFFRLPQGGQKIA